MRNSDNDIFVDYFVSPKLLESLQDEVLYKDKRVVFLTPQEESQALILKLLDRFSDIYSRMGATTRKDVMRKTREAYSSFNMERFSDAVREINERMFITYEGTTKLAMTSKPEYLNDMESIVMKKALNRAGWLVSETPPDMQRIQTYLIAPRLKEYKTDANEQIRNLESRLGANFEKPYNIYPPSIFYRKRNESNNKE